MTEKLTTRNPGPIAKKLLALESFKTNGALKGVAKPSWIGHGKMNVRYYELLHTDRLLYGIDYVVYSYDTPIAWLRGDGEWAMPEAKYSVTTTRHQTTIRAAIQEYKKAMPNLENVASRPVAESALITRLRLVLGKNLNQSDIDFLHVLAHPDVIDFTFEYIDYNYMVQEIIDEDNNA